MLADIIIDELLVHAIIGCLPEERITKQPVTISLSIQVDISMASATDNIKHALDYAKLSEEIKLYVESSSFRLIETLAEGIVDIVFKYEQAKQVSLLVYKPNAVKETKRVGIKLVRVNNAKQVIQSSDALSWD